jgi:hypothetical protein
MAEGDIRQAAHDPQFARNQDLLAEMMNRRQLTQQPGQMTGGAALLHAIENDAPGSPWGETLGRIKTTYGGGWEQTDEMKGSLDATINQRVMDRYDRGEWTGSDAGRGRVEKMRMDRASAIYAKQDAREKAKRAEWLQRAAVMKEARIARNKSKPPSTPITLRPETIQRRADVKVSRRKELLADRALKEARQKRGQEIRMLRANARRGMVPAETAQAMRLQQMMGQSPRAAAQLMASRERNQLQREMMGQQFGLDNRKLEMTGTAMKDAQFNATEDRAVTRQKNQSESTNAAQRTLAGMFGQAQAHERGIAEISQREQYNSNMLGLDSKRLEYTKERSMLDDAFRNKELESRVPDREQMAAAHFTKTGNRAESESLLTGELPAYVPPAEDLSDTQLITQLIDSGMLEQEGGFNSFVQNFGSRLTESQLAKIHYDVGSGGIFKRKDPREQEIREFIEQVYRRRHGISPGGPVPSHAKGLRETSPTKPVWN